MSTKFSQQSQLSELLNRVDGYANLDVVAKLKIEFNISQWEAGLLFYDVKRFLFLRATQEGVWSPPSKIDDGWHEFILFTKDYTDFCKLFFSRFIHHSPARINAKPKIGAVEVTIERAKVLYGRLSLNWDNPKKIQVSSCNCACGSCSCGF